MGAHRSGVAFDVHYVSVAPFHVYVSEDEMCHAHSSVEPQIPFSFDSEVNMG